VLTTAQRGWRIHDAQDIKAQPVRGTQKGIAAIGCGTRKQGNARRHE
jgi:hypothetical protein